MMILKGCYGWINVEYIMLIFPKWYWDGLIDYKKK